MVYRPDPRRWSLGLAREESPRRRSNQCFRCGSSEIDERTVEELIRRGPYVVAIRLPTNVCARCGERYVERDGVTLIEEVRGRVDRGELEGFRVAGEVLELVDAPR